MSRKRLLLIALPCVVLIVSGVTLAQQRGESTLPADRAGVPDWKVDERFKNDVFTFVRVEYDSQGGRGRRGGRGFGGFGAESQGQGAFGFPQPGGRGFPRQGGFGFGYGYGPWERWKTDWPDSDLNFSYRLQQLTSLKVNPEPISMRLTDERLFDYPFLYMIEPGMLSFSEEEVVALRRYLFNGGFLMVDDFWGDWEWENFYRQIKRVFPEREPEELDISHPIFNCVYRLKEKPQVPNIRAAQAGREQGITWEYRPGDNTREVHFKAIFDDKHRMMAIICHNTDLGDGWEREGEEQWYFHEFSEKKAYPMGINIVTYAMSH